MGKNIPLMVNLVTTNRCNSNCMYCKINRADRTYEMSTNEILEMISKLSKMGMHRIHFTGGEPLLRHDLGKIIQHAKQNKQLIILTTNAFGLEEKIDEIKDVDLLFVCLNGSKDIHEKLRGRGSFDATIKALELARINKINVAINMIITKYNIDQLDYVMDIARTYGVKVNFTPVYDNNLARVKKRDIKHLQASDEELMNIFVKIIKLKKNEKNVLNSMEYLKFIKNDGLRDFPINKCLMGKLAFIIAPNGDVMPCYKYLDYHNQGTTFKNGLKEGWEKAILETRVPKCNMCNYNCHIEQNLLLHFSWSSLLNLFENYNIFQKFAKK